MDALLLFIDGGSRGNPGPAGYGVAVCDAGGAVCDRLWGSLGRCTNNFAEYQGLLAALRYARARGALRVRVYSDSELLVRQVQGRYQVRSPLLAPLYAEARQLAESIPDFAIAHIQRARNAEADRLANRAMDEAMGRGTLQGSLQTPPAEPAPVAAHRSRSGKPTATGRRASRHGTGPPRD